MDGLHEIAGSGVPARIGGQIYYLLPLRAADWGEAARYLNARRTPPLDIVKGRLPGLAEADRKHLLELAYRDERDGDLLDMDTVRRWFSAPEGAAYKLWLIIRRNHPEITLERAGDMLREIEDDEATHLARTANATEGLPEGNCSGL